MGKHFDTLAEVVNKHMADNESAPGMPNAREYFGKLVRKSALFEFPFDPKDIFPNSGKVHEDYNKYVLDYFRISEKYNQFLITPFKFTAIEDPISVVFLDPTEYGSYRVTLSRRISPFGGKPAPPITGDVVCADVSIDISGKLGVPFVFDVMPLYHVAIFGDNRINPRFVSMKDPVEFGCAATDIRSAAMAFIEENIYMMDPENFIVEKKHREYEVEKERREKKNKNGKNPQPDKLYKTIMRPHYTCMSQDDVTELFSSGSDEVKPPKAVRGHWRMLMSEKFVNKRWQIIPIAQYWKGDGEIKTEGGWKYQIWLKDSPDKIRPYKRE